MREAIAGLDDDVEITFAGMTFFRWKERGEKLVQMEFSIEPPLDPNQVQFLIAAGIKA